MTQRPTTWQGIEIPYGASLEELSAMIDGPAPGRWVAFRALASAPGPAAVAALARYAGSADPMVRRAAIEGIGHHPQGRLAGAQVRDALRDANEFVVRTACAATAKLGLAEAHDLVRALVVDAIADTRRAAIAALEALWQDSDYSLILERFTMDPADDVRKQAAWCLHAHVTSSNWLELFTLWSTGSLPRYRTWSCQLAAKFGAVEVVPQLEILARDSDGHVRSAAERALGCVAGAP